MTHESDRLICHVDMDAFFASVEQHANPALRRHPVAVCGDPTGRSVVAACSYEAKAYGITNGMSVQAAKRLCPELILVAGHPQQYREIARRIFALLETFTPDVEIFSIDEAFLDITGTVQRFGATPEACARRIKQQIFSTVGLTCSIGIGPNKLIAKVASKMQKPDGLVRIRPEETPMLMSRLPIERLCGIGPHLTTALHEMGITTCAQLGATSVERLAERFGMVGRHLQQMGQGVDHHPVIPMYVDTPAKSMGHAYTLPHDTASEPEIRATLLRLAEQVGRRMRADHVQGRVVQVTVRYADFSGITRQRTLSEPTDSGLRVYRAAWELFRHHCEPLSQRVRLLGVTCAHLTGQPPQLSFLPDEVRLARIDRCLDQLAERFGDDAVVRASALTPLTEKTHGFLMKRQGPLSTPRRS